jgi:ABC-type histidine transport system ATPase subunit
MEPISLAIIGGVSWIGLLAKNYYTEMTKLAIERAARQEQNEQDRIKREREQFDIVFQNLLTRVNEERDVIQALISEIKQSIDRSADVDRELLLEINYIRRERAAYLPTNMWDGNDRRSPNS